MNSASTTLLTEHLRWTPLSLIDDIINTINDILYQSVAAIENFLLNSNPPHLGFVPPSGTIPDTDGDGNILFSEKEAEEINKGVHALETLLENGVDKYFDTFELYVLRNILVVNPELVGWVRLAHHRDLDFSSIPTTTLTDSATSTKPLPPAHEAQSRIRTLRQTLLASHALNHTLRSEIATNARSLSQLRMLASTVTTSVDGLENPLSFINGSGGAKEIKESASFAVSQADLIRSLVKKLRPQFDALQAQRALREAEEAMKEGEDTEMKDVESAVVVTVTAEEERKRYIERMTRRHMEASRGLRLNAKGEVVGGNFEGAAKKRLAEVEALEGVVAGLVEKKEDEGFREGGISLKGDITIT